MTEDLDLTLFLGGTRSGKSALAEALVTARAQGPVWYLATARPLGTTTPCTSASGATAAAAPPAGTRWNVPRHPGRELERLLAAHAGDGPVPTVLLDCVTLWMSNILFALDDPTMRRPSRPASRKKWRDCCRPCGPSPCRWVLVSGETGLGGYRRPLARIFDDGLGLANQMLAAQARDAFLVVAGRCLRLEKADVLSSSRAARRPSPRGPGEQTGRWERGRPQRTRHSRLVSGPPRQPVTGHCGASIPPPPPRKNRTRLPSTGRARPAVCLALTRAAAPFRHKERRGHEKKRGTAAAATGAHP